MVYFDVAASAPEYNSGIHTEVQHLGDILQKRTGLILSNRDAFIIPVVYMKETIILYGELRFVGCCVGLTV